MQGRRVGLYIGARLCKIDINPKYCQHPYAQFVNAWLAAFIYMSNNRNEVFLFNLIFIELGICLVCGAKPFHNTLFLKYQIVTAMAYSEEEVYTQMKNKTL